MDRSIPHIRNIFSTSSRKKSTSDTQDLCQHEKSPRNRKKSNKDHDHKNTSSPKKAFDFGKENHKSGDEHRKSGGRNGNYNTYTSKTLTEKDMKHLERHLSMKKTIRKQISRNLAQAFLDNPNIFEPVDDKSGNHVSDHALPDKKDIAKTEQNVLDLLKISIDDRDSGHSSPTHENLEDTDFDDDDDPEEALNSWRSCSKHRNSDTKGLVEDKPKYCQEPEKKSSSIWKMFSPRHKGKR